MPAAPTLPPNTIHLWRLALDLPPEVQASVASALSPDEAARAARFHFEHDQLHFTAARGQLRQVLAAYTALTPAAVPLATDAHGKPFISSDPQLHFNLAHSGSWALLAVTRRAAVGVDIEHVRTGVERDSIAPRFFAPAEARRLAALPTEEQDQAFFRCWTRKEAYVKARGEGLSLPLDEFEVSLDATPQLVWVADDEAEAARWTFYEPDTPAGYVGAVAIRALDVRLADRGVWAARA